MPETIEKQNSIDKDSEIEQSKILDVEYRVLQTIIDKEWRGDKSRLSIWLQNKGGVVLREKVTKFLKDLKDKGRDMWSGQEIESMAHDVDNLVKI
jgi:hypothetical protein